MNIKLNDTQNQGINASDTNLIGILKGNKYAVDYYQREYRWEQYHINQLIDDLIEEFMLNYQESDRRETITKYSKYYMGPIIFHKKIDGSVSIIDGQQRLTSFILLLIYLHHQQKEQPDVKQVPILDLIRSTKFGKESFNIQVPEGDNEYREECLSSLLDKGEYTPPDDNDLSVNNMIERYKDIKDLSVSIPSEKEGLYFTDWLLENVIFVNIYSYTEDNAYMIFETMNDRGLNLRYAEMLKGFLISKTQNEERANYDKKWKKIINAIGQKKDNRFFQAWLRGQYAKSIRVTKKGAKNQDFENIGTRFHVWFKQNQNTFLNNNSGDIYHLFDKNLSFYSNVFKEIINAINKPTEGLENLYHLKYCHFADSLMEPLFLSAISIGDDKETWYRKARLVAHYIETFCVYKRINKKSFSHSYIRVQMCQLVKAIRNKSANELGAILALDIQNTTMKLDVISDFNLKAYNKSFVKFLLNRITSHVDKKTSGNSTFDIYAVHRKDPFTIEHIWADNYERLSKEFTRKEDFEEYRNKLGALLIVPKSFNSSFSDKTYEYKLPKYIKQNLLAGSLNKDCYNNDPNFAKYIRNSGLPFKPHNKFGKDELQQRGVLYQRIAEEIWGLDTFKEI